ncbi:hypothetical protein L228DRAFT_246490 [Xylona heveae TC161]|uniref:Uncharacterized protein n=1 Tax=Xylona heveae (strain CBS 132557 / TC161) TaxID=1328760 RepID=A0A161TCX7_XYLHT|nr:hypothetical protein L228DRAFT_246490 [Xylona heveae TC161]KZF23657.1 hypothetical protein L228DRAFT_246490 [Xylona heveae TC161]
MPSSAGTKVTSDPERFENPTLEKPGTVVSDSLAGESVRGGGSFASNPSANPSGVNAASTTANTTDTSAATKLDAAPSAGSRQTQSGSQQTSQSKGPQNVGTAPSSIAVDFATGETKPKGVNLREGGFDSDSKYNASFTSDIGGKNDPGRLAEAKFQRAAAESGPDAAGGPRQKGVSGDGQYDALNSDQAA